MKDSFKKNVTLTRALEIIFIAIVLFVPPVNSATTSSLTILGINEDQFYNYDFLSQQASGSNVDWPVTMVFYNNADVNKVKLFYFRNCVLCNTMYEQVNDGSGGVWTSDTGTKATTYSTYLGAWVYLHMRLYAPCQYYDPLRGWVCYLYNSAWERYVIGTTHYDEYPLERWSGYSEYAENDFAATARARGWNTVFEDWSNFYNNEAFRNENNHIWLNNGYATAVYVP